MPFSVEGLRQLASTRQQASAADREQQYWEDGEEGGIILGNRKIPLARMTPEDRVDQRFDATFSVQASPRLWIEGQTVCGQTPDHCDRRAGQTPVRDQLDRRTCASFAVLAAMEAIIRQGGEEVDLSEQFVGWLVDGSQCQDVAQIRTVAERLERSGVCREELHPYQDRAQATLDCRAVPPDAARQNAIYLIDRWGEVPNTRLTGPSITNPDYLECLLVRGHEIVLEVEAAWFRTPEGILDARKDLLGAELFHTERKHALLVVGYDRRGDTPFFICKNSYGDTVEHNGYFYFSYLYVTLYAIRGLVVESVRKAG